MKITFITKSFLCSLVSIVVLFGFITNPKQSYAEDCLPMVWPADSKYDLDMIPDYIEPGTLRIYLKTNYEWPVDGEHRCLYMSTDFPGDDVLHNLVIYDVAGPAYTPYIDLTIGETHPAITVNVSTSPTGVGSVVPLNNSVVPAKGGGTGGGNPAIEAHVTYTPPLGSHKIVFHYKLKIPDYDIDPDGAQRYDLTRETYDVMLVPPGAAGNSLDGIKLASLTYADLTNVDGLIKTTGMSYTKNYTGEFRAGTQRDIVLYRHNYSIPTDEWEGRIGPVARQTITFNPPENSTPELASDVLACDTGSQGGKDGYNIKVSFLHTFDILPTGYHLILVPTVGSSIELKQDNFTVSPSGTKFLFTTKSTYFYEKPVGTRFSVQLYSKATPTSASRDFIGKCEYSADGVEQATLGLTQSGALNIRANSSIPDFNSTSWRYCLAIAGAKSCAKYINSADGEIYLSNTYAPGTTVTYQVWQIPQEADRGTEASSAVVIASASITLTGATGTEAPEDAGPELSFGKLSISLTNLFIAIGVFASIFLLPYIGFQFARGTETSIKTGKDMLEAWIWGMILLLFGGTLVTIIGTQLFGLT